MYDDTIRQASEKYGVPQSLIKAVITAESSWNPNATSGAGAGGLMQLMPATASSLGVTDVYDPEQNIMGGTKYLASAIQTNHGSVPLALASYNAGQGAVDKYGGVPPYAETQNYVSKIMTSLGVSDWNNQTSLNDIGGSYVDNLDNTNDSSTATPTASGLRGKIMVAFMVLLFLILGAVFLMNAIGIKGGKKS